MKKTFLQGNPEQETIINFNDADRKDGYITVYTTKEGVYNGFLKRNPKAVFDVEKDSWKAGAVTFGSWSFKIKYDDVRLPNMILKLGEDQKEKGGSPWAKK